MNTFTKFHQNPSIGPQDIKHKPNFNIIKGHNSVENEQKILFNHPNLHLVNINAYTKFDQNPQRTSMLKACVFPKRLTDLGQIF